MNLSERRKGASVKTETEDAPGASSGSELWNVVDLVDELDVDRITVFGSSRSHQGTNCVCSTATLADHSAHVSIADTYVEADGVIVVLAGVNADSVGVLDNRSYDVT